MNIVIPARKGSKGFPKKNQHLLKHTLESIPKKYYKDVIVSTDDEIIIKTISTEYPNIQIHKRSVESASDTVSTKLCLQEVIQEHSLTGDIIMLYLTYPERLWNDVIRSYEWYIKTNAKSMLCREECKIHPYVHLYDIGDDYGRQIVEHDLYRRQDYPICFKICHIITIFKTTELNNLNGNLYNNETKFYKISHSVDIDSLVDFEKIKTQ